jgi:DNA invertase Pin-like site-specific DNA recombinase
MRNCAAQEEAADVCSTRSKAAGCYRIFADTASGALDERPELAKVLDQLRPGDTLVVWKLGSSPSRR